MWQAFRNGSAYDLRGGDEVQDDANGTSPWGAERTVRARMVALLLLSGPSPLPGRATALKITGARITGPLDLSNSQIDVPVELRGCRFEAPVRLVDCQMRTVIFDGCAIPALEAARLTTAGDLQLSSCTIPFGISMPQAQIGTDLTVNFSRLHRDRRGRAWIGDGLNVGQDLNAELLSTSGEISLRGARVGGQFSLRGASLNNEHGRWALNALRLVVEESLFLAPGAASQNLSRIADTPARGTRVQRTEVRGGVLLDGATFGNGLIIEYTRFHLADDQEVSLRSVQAPELRFMPERPERGRIVLANATVGRLVDKADSWPGPGQLELQGFTYETLAPGGPFPLAARLAWLAAATPTYSPEPYDRLAASLRATGEDADANDVTLAKLRRRRADLPLAPRAWEGFQDLVLGYGYRPARGLFWLVSLWLAGSLWFASYPPPPLNADEAPHWQPAIYTLDLLLPVLDLGQEAAWRTSGASQWIALFLVILGWLLATIVTAGAAAVILRRN
ncbi:oxidoreductase [Streptomyces chartreusis]|uniref:oxidoreductase n=1 Tax=Streptomyces chartreusis TaxID=1969 RepID=UPI00371E3B4C